MADGKEDTYKTICACELNWPEHVNISAEAKDLVSKLLVREPSQRISLDEVIEHPWIKKNARLDL
jgi:aurora kinase